MPINPNGANSQNDALNFAQEFDAQLEKRFARIGNLDVRTFLNGGLLQDAPIPGQTTNSILLDSLINNVDQPLLRGMLMDTISVVSNWFEDPEVLCCLIQGLWAMYAASYSNTKLAQAKTSGGVQLADTDFADWIDILIAFVDLITSFLASDIKKIVIMIPDLIKEIMNGIIGAILLVLQQVLFAIRDSAINTILSALDRAADGTLSMSNIWAKCIPFSQLLEVMKKYVSDYGLFAELFEKIKGFVSGKVGDFGYMKQFDFPQNIKDLEFLKWFRDLLVRLKQATINYDLCVYYNDSSASGNDNTYNMGDGDITSGSDDDNKRRPNPSDVQGIKVGADGTILQDTGDLRNNSIPILSNSSIRTFLNKYYGFPLDVVDNLLTGSSSADGIQGTNINAANLSAINADCPNSPSPEEIVKWALRIKNRNL